MNRPSLLPTKVTDETYAGLTYHLEGELVPTLTIELPGEPTVYFEHHVMLWKNTSVDIKLKSISGAVKRMFAGMQIFVTETQGVGQIAFSRDCPGHILPIHLKKGQELDVREHRFLAATSNIKYDFFRVKGFANMFVGGNGFFIDRFICGADEGILWLHGFGNVFEKHLEEGEQIDLKPGSWLYKDPSVKLETKVQKLRSGLFGAANLMCNRFTGPGRLGLQSMDMILPMECS